MKPLNALVSILFMSITALAIVFFAAQPVLSQCTKIESTTVPELNRTCAIKIVAPYISKNPQNIVQFMTLINKNIESGRTFLEKKLKAKEMWMLPPDKCFQCSYSEFPNVIRLGIGNDIVYIPSDYVNIK